MQWNLKVWDEPTVNRLAELYDFASLFVGREVPAWAKHEIEFLERVRDRGVAHIDEYHKICGCLGT